MKDRFIKLHRRAFLHLLDTEKPFTHANYADYLLANGVIVPPCKVGDTVYATSESRIAECRVDEICIYGNENIVMTEHTCDYDCKGCPFNSWGQDYSGEHSCQGEYGVYSFNFEDFGNTVFLTREEAEKALAERSKNDNT